MCQQIKSIDQVTMMTRQILLVVTALIAVHLHGNCQAYERSIGLTLLSGATTLIERDYGYEAARFASGLSIDLEQRILKDFLYLQTGLQIIDRGYSAHIPAAFVSPTANPADLYTYRENLLFITVPLGIAFHVKGFHIGAGGNIGYPLRRKVTIDRSLSYTDYSFKPELRLFGAQASIGYEFHLSERLLLSVGGFASTTFNPRFINAGIETGLRFVSEKHYMKSFED